MGYRNMFEVSKEEARNRLVTDIMQVAMKAEKMAAAAHDRNEALQNELQTAMNEIGKQSKRIDNLEKAIAKMREWAAKKEKASKTTGDNDPATA